MSFLKFPRRIKLLPGLWVNLSKKGVSISAGMKGFTVNSRGRSTVSLPGSGLSYVFTPKKRAQTITDRAQKESNIAALWDRFTEDLPNLEVWVPTNDSTPAQIEKNLILLRSKRSTLQEDYDTWKAAKDTCLAELKPLVSEELYQRVSSNKEIDINNQIISGLASMEAMLYQAKEQLTPVDVTFSVRENAPGPPQFHFLSPNGEGIMDMFGNVLSVIKSNALFSAETKKVQDSAKGNKGGFVDKMYKLWGEAHTNTPTGEAGVSDSIANSVGSNKTADENEPPVVSIAQPPIAESPPELKPKAASILPYAGRILLVLFAIAIIANMVSPKPNVPRDKPTEDGILSHPVMSKESDDQIRSENTKILDALQQHSSVSSPLPTPESRLGPTQSDNQRRTENQKILDGLSKLKHRHTE